MVGARARKWYDDEAKKRQQVRKGKQAGATVESLPHLADSGKARDAVGKVVGVSGKSIDFATHRWQLDSRPGTLRTMVPFVKLVATIAGCLSGGALAGAYLADVNGYNPYLFAVLGGVAGAYFGLAAAGEIRGRLLDPLFPPGRSRSTSAGEE